MTGLHKAILHDPCSFLHIGKVEAGNNITDDLVFPNGKVKLRLCSISKRMFYHIQLIFCKKYCLGLDKRQK